MAVNMYQYILETPEVLRHIIENRAEITKEFVEKFKDTKIEQIYVLGSGTSFHAGLSAKNYLEEMMKIKIICMYPTQFERSEKVFNPNTLVIGMSQGGQSMSTVAGLDAARRQGFGTAGVSANAHAFIFEHADTKTMVEVGNEKCGAKTKGYAGTAVTLMMMLTELALAKGIVSQQEVDAYLARMYKVIDNLGKVTKASTEWYGRIKDEFIPAKRIIVVGYDGIYADVLEGALKILETVRQGVSGYDIEEFFHGIYNSITDSAHIFYLASESDYKPRTLKLIEILSEWTPHNYLVASPKGVPNPTGKDLIVEFTEDPLFGAWEYIIPMQVVACLAPQDLGIDPDIPKDPNFHRRIGSKNMDGVNNPYGVEDDKEA